MIKILVVDDEAGICDIIEKTFSCMGFSVATATTAQRARALFAKEHPQIVFLDLIMPDIDGEILLREFKVQDPQTIVLVVTAKNDPLAKKMVQALGADECIHKPFSLNYLRDIVTSKIHAVMERAGQMQRPKILLVDDEPELRAGMRDFIKLRFDCDLFEAGSAGEAISLVQQELPDVVFLDIKMPGLSGLEAIPQLKALSPSSRIVVVSAWRSVEVVSRAIQMGAEDYIEKPVSFPAFAQKLRTILLSIGKLTVKSPPNIRS